MPTEAEFEDTADAKAGRDLLEAGLKRLAPEDLEAFREAVRRCYAGTSDDRPQDRDSA